MSNLKIDPLFQLIKTLSKAEKRNFKLFVNRTSTKETAKFIRLFDAMDSMENLDEKIVLKRVPEIKKSQLSNLKAHLYKQILVVLRLNHVQHNIDMQLRESIDYAKVLYNKGLYKQSLKLLDKAKQAAMDARLNTLAFQVLEFEKLIESQFITRSIRNRADELVGQSKKYSAVIGTNDQLSSLALRLYALYLRMGHIRSEEDFNIVKSFMEDNLPEVDEKELSFFERLYLYQSHVWYNYIVQDFLLCYRYAQKWVDLFHDNRQMIEQNPVLYLKGLHNLLAALFNLTYYDKFIQVLDALEQMRKHKHIKINQNIEVLLFLYSANNRINKHFLEGSFSEGLRFVPLLVRSMKKYELYLDPHRIMIFYYKIACLYFGSGDNLKAIYYLEKVLRYKDVGLREDIQSFARMLNLIAHYDEGLDESLEYQVKSLYHYLAKRNDLRLVQQEIIMFLKKLNGISALELRAEFINLRNRLVEIRLMKFEKRPFLYLDIISWLESKIDNVPVQQVMHKKFLAAQTANRKMLNLY